MAVETYKTLQNTKSVTILVIAFSAFIFCFMGLSNNFPLLFPDTGTYIGFGFNGKMPEDRPVIYGLFIRHISLHESPWLVIYAQGLILAYVLYKLFGLFFSGKRLLLVTLTFVFTTTFLTGVSINVSQLIPDIFTPISIIVITVLILDKGKLLTPERSFLFLIGVLSIGVHNSHGLICLALVAVWWILQLTFHRKGRITNQVLRQTSFIIPMIIFGIFLNNLASIALGGSFFPKNGAHVFLMSRFSEEGLLDTYLHDKCGEKNYRICEYKDKIPLDFIWDAESPLSKTGGWEANENEYKTIIADILTTPRYFKKFLIKSFEGGLVQLCSFSTDDNRPVNYGVLNDFPDYIRLYRFTAQCNGHINHDFINLAQRFLVMFCAFFLGGFLIITSSHSYQDLRNLIFLLVAGIIFNAFVCATLSTISPRYESRVIWLIAIPVFIITIQSKWAEKFFTKIGVN